MEHIGEVLAQSHRQGNIPVPKMPDEPTVEERKEDLRRRLNLTSWDNTFENFLLVKGSEDSLAAFKELAFGKASWYMLLCYGSDGCGKTHLCEALSIELAKRNIVCRVNEWAEVVRDFKRRMHSEIFGDYDDVFERFRTQPYLIIDDVGMGGTGSSWEWGELEEIINYRSREGLMTVVTTNLNIEPNPKDYNQSYVPRRIVSRFTDAVKSRLIVNRAGNYRPKKGKG